ncbi:MAG TPA: histidine kinase [Verrucomicrobiae bacterium]|nr:histidine kinase [Verrucomicrobiae bacterium]
MCFVLLIALTGLARTAGAEAPRPAFQALEKVTHVSEFRTIPAQSSLRGWAFRLEGTVTLADTNRHLVVLQDSTGAVALDMGTNRIQVVPGQVVRAESPEACPCVSRFPDYPFRPSGSDICTNFEAPSNWGNWHLTRMRALLHPPVTGEYTFWIASDNSSELWLSHDQDPANVRKIAFIPSGAWVDSREWSHYGSQRSESIGLIAGHTYYIEAFQEQLTEADYLAVAWQGPGLAQSVIDGQYLTPAMDRGDFPAPTNGILREYWTNYSAGNFEGLTGPRSFDSVLTTRAVQMTVLGQGKMPEPRRIALDQAISPEDSETWVETEGALRFVGIEGNSATIELSAGEHWTQLHVEQWRKELPKPLPGWLRVHAVCEGARYENGLVVPGFLWAPSSEQIVFFDKTNTPWNPVEPVTSDHLPRGSSSNALAGYHFTRGVVTFNNRVLGKDYLFIQDDTGGVFVSQDERDLRNQLQVGQLVEIGGQLSSGKYGPSLRPLVLSVAGWHLMPQADVHPLEQPMPTTRHGRWTELEGVVHAVQPDGTLMLMSRRGTVSVWVSDTPMAVLLAYPDFTLRVRGVLSLSTLEKPMLLVPSRRFLEVEEEPGAEMVALHRGRIDSLKVHDLESKWIHRAKVQGNVTFSSEKTLFVEDESGGARVQTMNGSQAQLGDRVEVVGFPEPGGASPVLTDALVRRIGAGEPVTPRRVDLNDLVAGKHVGSLVRILGTVMAQTRRSAGRVLELQEAQRGFQALLAAGQGGLPSFDPGSLLEITGVGEVQLTPAAALAEINPPNNALASVQILMRSPLDVRLLSGPPWWTWRRAAALVGTLMMVLVGSLLWVYFLRRRLAKQQIARIAFSRQILQGQESERRRIAGNLHDSLGQNLLVIKNQARLGLQPAADESLLRQRLDAISGVASQAIEEIRQITHDLRPYQLDRLGLTLAIRAAISRVSENSPVLFASHVDNIDGLFDKESEIHVYRIVQEGLNNIIKHSGATEAAVVIKHQPHSLTLSIRDNGRGFEAGSGVAADPDAAGFGLSGIRERSRILGGSLDLEARPGQGASLSLQIPLRQSQHET